MKTKFLTVTPNMASLWLEKTEAAIEAGKFRQRPVSQSTVDLYANDLRNSKWLSTHQGIAISESDWVLDGRHRLYAIQKAGRSVEMLVTTDIPNPKINGDIQSVQIMDVIDGGKARTNANKLSISHGVKNAALTSATVVAIAQFSVGSTHLRLTTAAILDILQRIYPSEIEWVVTQGVAQKHSKTTAGIIAPIAIYMSQHPVKARSFLNDLIAMEGLTAGSPVLALIKVLSRGAFALRNREARFKLMVTTANALKAFHENAEMTECRSSQEARVWLLNLAKNQTNMIRNMFRAEGLKLAMHPEKQ